MCAMSVLDGHELGIPFVRFAGWKPRQIPWLRRSPSRHLPLPDSSDRSVSPRLVLKFEEMSHRLHLLMEYSNHKNVMFTLPVKYGMSLVIVASHSIGDVVALIAHQWRTGEETQGALQVIGVCVSLVSTEIKQGVFVYRCKILYRKIRQFIHGVSVSPARQSPAETGHFPRFALRL